MLSNLAAAILLLHLALVQCCFLHGTDSGICSEETLDPAFTIQYMPFCYPIVTYPACLPKPQIVPPMREFPEGRWSNHTVLTKDTWIKDSFFEFVQERIRIEKNKIYKNTGTNEFGEQKRIKHRFSKHRDCATSFKNLFCWMNFPRCDVEKGLTLPMCESACHNFFKACGYRPDLKRCGRTEYFNGNDPESPAGFDANGDPIYLRDYYPGQPWVRNKYSQGGHELAVCTPAIDGAAAPSAAVVANSHLVLVGSLFATFFYIMLL